MFFYLFINISETRYIFIEIKKVIFLKGIYPEKDIK
jgi:hypothetical protein